MVFGDCIYIFVRQSLREGGIPFAIKTERPNKETIAALLKAEKDCERSVGKGLHRFG